MTRAEALRLLALSAAVNLSMALGATLWLRHDQRPAFGTLDVAELYRLKEAQIAAVLVKRDSADADRLLAIQRAAAFGAELSQAIEGLPKQCGCMVLVKGALLGSDTQVMDLTDQVRRQLRLGERP